MRRARIGNGSSPRRLGSRLGLTITELLVTITLSSIVTGSMLSFFLLQTKSSRTSGVRAEAVQRARFASEMLRREMALAGAGIPDAQPLVVYAGPSDFVFSADLASSTPGDRVAVYRLPDAPRSETEGADSGSVVLPNGEAYPRRWYGPSRTPGPAETVRFSFVSLEDGKYALVRAVNAQPEDTLLRGLRQIPGRDFFSYRVRRDDGGLRDLGGGPIWHAAAVHESAADTGGSALTDSIKLARVAFTVMVRGRRGELDVERHISMGIALRNAGLIRNAACGDPPLLGVDPVAEVTGLDPPAVTVRWGPALDETAGEMDVRQYTLYRREQGVALPLPIASLPPNPDLPGYTYVDTALEPGTTYVYLLGATDCTPAQSRLAESAPVAVPEV